MPTVVNRPSPTLGRRVDSDDIHLAERARNAVWSNGNRAAPRSARQSKEQTRSGSNHGSPRRSARSASVQPPCSGCQENAALFTRSSSASSCGPGVGGSSGSPRQTGSRRQTGQRSLHLQQLTQPHLETRVPMRWRGRAPGCRAPRSALPDQLRATQCRSSPRRCRGAARRDGPPPRPSQGCRRPAAPDSDSRGSLRPLDGQEMSGAVVTESAQHLITDRGHTVEDLAAAMTSRIWCCCSSVRRSCQPIEIIPGSLCSCPPVVPDASDVTDCAAPAGERISQRLGKTAVVQRDCHCPRTGRRPDRPVAPSQVPPRDRERA